ncbi:MAG: class I SAM-dependent methyltransferase [Dehalococcoidia bacterium]|nr:class I SAM-dependent methyltransferase [Dehalococcoidia bacterium]
MEYSQYDPWADIYDAVYSYVRADIPLYTQEAVESGGPVLELGVGTGRIAIPTAQLGIDVVGIDTSEAMLSQARRKLKSLREGSGDVELIAADMRDFDLRDENAAQRKFPLITIPFRGFLALMTVEEQIRTFERIRSHLSPGGRLVFNIFVPDPNIAFEQSDVPRHLNDVTDPVTGASYVLYQQSWYETYDQIVSIRMLIEELDRDNTVVRKMYRDYSLRYCYRWEIHHLLVMCGFEIEELFGDFDRSVFGPGSTEMIWVARRG